MTTRLTSTCSAGTTSVFFWCNALLHFDDVAWNRTYPADGRSADQHDAWVVAEWMRTADANGALSSALRPALDVDDRKLAEIEAWILGVG